MRLLCFFLVWGWLVSPCFADLEGRVRAQRVAQLFELVRQDPILLNQFLLAFPKGGDLHHHATGSHFPEALIEKLGDESKCINIEIGEVGPPPCTGIHTHSVDHVLQNESHYQQLVNRWSLRGFDIEHVVPVETNDRFFSIFPKTEPLMADFGKILTSFRRRAQDENLLYIETLIALPEINASVQSMVENLSKQPDLGQSEEVWLSIHDELVQQKAFQVALLRGKQRLAAFLRESDNELACFSDGADPACQVEIRYQYYALRVLPFEQFFADMVLALALSHASEQVVGVNMVGYENHSRAVRDFEPQMHLLGLLKRERYPQANVALHTGELALSDTVPDVLRHRISNTLAWGQPKRLGHATSIAYEKNAVALAAGMASQDVAVEILLSSNQWLLGVQPSKHPMMFYHHAGVPVVLASDDPGIMRTTLTEQYVLAATAFPELDYADFKDLSRNALHYSFLPGQSIWSAMPYEPETNVCAQLDASACVQLRGVSVKAEMQVRLEQALERFEQQILRWPAWARMQPLTGADLTPAFHAK